MQNLALSSQFGNNGRRGSSSSNSFNSLVLNGVLPPSEDGRVEVNEGIKAPPKKSKKIIYPDKTPDGFGFPDGKPGDGDFGKERKWAQEQDGYRSPDNSGHYIIPPNTYVNPGHWGRTLMEELERKNNQSETEEEKERREYGYQLYDRLKNLFNPRPNDYIVDIAGLRTLDWVSGINEVFESEEDKRYLKETVGLLIEALLSETFFNGKFEEILNFIKNKEININKEFTYIPFLPEVFNPPLRTYYYPDKNNVREIRSVQLKVVVKFVNGKAVVFIYATINHSGVERTVLLFEQPIEF